MVLPVLSECIGPPPRRRRKARTPPRRGGDSPEDETDLDVIAITDHDDRRGAREAREVCARGRYRFQVVTGMEVTATEGHIIALWVEEPLPSLRPVEEVLEAVHRQGGLAVAAHPLSWLTRSLGQKTLDRLVAAGRNGAHMAPLGARNKGPRPP